MTGTDYAFETLDSTWLSRHSEFFLTSASYGPFGVLVVFLTLSKVVLLEVAMHCNGRSFKSRERKIVKRLIKPLGHSRLIFAGFPITSRGFRIQIWGGFVLCTLMGLELL